MDASLTPRGRTTVAWIEAALGILVLVPSAGALKPFVRALIAAHILHPRWPGSSGARGCRAT